MADDSVGIEVGAEASGAISVFDALSASIDKFGGSMTSAAGSFATVSDAANSTIVPSRAAHQELNLVTRELAGMAGMSGAAEAPLRVLDTTLYSLVATGGAISIPFLAATAAIVGITTAFESSKKSAEEEEKAFDSLISKNESFIGSNKDTAQSIADEDKKMLDHLQTVLKMAEQYPTLGSKIIGTWDQIKTATAQDLDVMNRVISGILDPITNAYTKGYQLSDAFAKIGDMFGTASPKIAETKTEISKLNEEMAKLNAKKAADDFDAESEAMDMLYKNYEKIQAGITKASLAEEQGFASMKKDQLDYQVALDKRYQDQDAKERASFGLMKTNADQYKSIMSSTFQSISSGVGNSFAKMAVEGKNFGDSMKQLGIDVAESLISKFVAMGVEWAVMQAFRLATHTAAEGGITAATEASAVATLATDKIIKVHEAITSSALAVLNAEAFGALGGPIGSGAAGAAEEGIVAPMVVAASAAVGADFIADEPTHLLVGEGGQAERISVTPMSQSGSSNSAAASGQGININFGDIIVQGIQNPRDFADQIALLVTQSIRGRAQLNMTGRGIY